MSQDVTRHTERQSAAAPSPAIEVQHVRKRFGATVALNDVSLAFSSGKLYGILGENGSGKSTLVKLLSGVLRPDSGVIRIHDSPLTKYQPREPIRQGLATVYQEVLVAKNLSVLKNLYLWDAGWIRGRVSSDERRARAAKILGELSDQPPSLDAPVGSISLGAQQLVVIARAILQQPRIVILDEATAALDADDAGKVLSWAGAHRDSGGTVLLISHRLAEVEQATDEVVVLREGRVAGALSRGHFTAQRAVEMMSPERKRQAPSVARPEGAKRIDGQLSRSARQRALGVDTLHGPDTLEIYGGELTGFAGLDGQGQADLLRALGGWDKSGPVVEVLGADGRWQPLRGARDALRHGIAYIPRDRKTDGILPSRSVLENFALPNWESASTRGFIRPKIMKDKYSSFVTKLSIKSSGPDALITSLSGGSQQKVILARWLARDPQVFLLDDPTRGIDQHTKLELYNLFRQLADEGKALVMLSTDVEELSYLCDRVVVFHQRMISADIHRISEQRIPVHEIINAMFNHRERTNPL